MYLNTLLCIIYIKRIITYCILFIAVDFLLIYKLIIHLQHKSNSAVIIKSLLSLLILLTEQLQCTVNIHPL